MADGPRRGRWSMRTRLAQADERIHGRVWERLQRERTQLMEEETAHKEHMEAVAGFRKGEIIPIGKLQRAMDETDSESEPLSESEAETASGAHRASAAHPDLPAAADNDNDNEDDDDAEDLLLHQPAILPTDPQHSLLDQPIPLDDLDAQLEDFDSNDHSALLNSDNQSFPSFATEDQSQ